jgi:WD40 repeat protein
VWEVSTGKELRRWPIHGGWKFALSPDGKLLAGNGPPGANDSIALWNVSTGNRTWELPFEGARDGVSALAFSPDGTRLVSGGGTTLRLFDVSTGKQFRTFGEGKRINSVAFSADGKTLAVARSEEPVTLWDITTLKEARRIGDDPRGARTVAFSRDGKTLVVCGFGFGKASLWDSATGRKRRELQGKLIQVWDAAFSPDGRTLAVCNLDSRVRLWDVTSGKELALIGEHWGVVNFLAFIDGDRGIASASHEGLVCHWDLATARAVREFQEEGTHCFCGNLSPDGRTLALGDDEGVHFFDWSTGKNLRLLKGHKRQVWATVFSPDGKVLASSANMDQYILLWDVPTGKQLRRILTPFLHDLHSLAWSPDGKLLASAGVKTNNLGKIIDTVCLWNPATGKQVREWTMRLGTDRQTGGVRGLAFSPDGTRLAAADADNPIVVWDVGTGRSHARLPVQPRGVIALAFSPDGLMLASGGMDRTVRLWELATWKERRRYEGHLGGITKLAFSSDGLTLASTGGDTSVLLWSVLDSAPRKQRLENLWDDLLSEDTPLAWQAVCTMIQAPESAIPWLKDHLKRQSVTAHDRIAQLIADLDSDQFSVRRQSALDLEKLADLARPALLEAVRKRPSLEVRRQVEQLLEKLEGPVRAGEAVRELRSLEVPERIGTLQARQVLESLAGGPLEDRLTQGAKASLERLARRKTSMP